MNSGESMSDSQDSQDGSISYWVDVLGQWKVAEV